MHDLNSLFSLRDLKNNLKIILINNNGGGIFTLLPIQKEEDVLSVITSPHKEKFNTIALNFNMFYKELQDIKEFPETIKEFQKINSHALLEITVDHKLNQNIYNQLKTIKLS
jgi:2-succinyl-5-enolpyruvyl-6-hydroxy-3-cyclohexene-1-carboxylate synthase